MTILQEIKKDHATLKKKLSAIEKTKSSQSERRKKLFREFKQLLEAHARSEEEVLYRSLLQDKTSRDHTLEGYEEHHVADLLVKELSILSYNDERWHAKFEVLKESLEHHIKEEERETFKLARKFLRNEKMLKEMGAYFRVLVEERLGRAPRRTRVPTLDSDYVSEERLPV